MHLPDLPREQALAQLLALAARPELAFVPGGPERWFILAGDRRLALRAAMEALTGARDVAAVDLRAWLRSRGVPIERERRDSTSGTAVDRLPDRAAEEIEAAWDADLARGVEAHLRTGPQDWEWGVRHRGEVLPLKRAGALASGVASNDVQTADFKAWLARRGFEIVPPPGDPPRWWVFQGNPGLFDMRGAVAARSRLTWRTRQHRSAIRPGDRVALWESGAVGGIVAVATVLGPPTPGLEDEDEALFVRNADALGATESGVWLRIDRVVDPPLGRAALLADPALADLSVLRTPQGTNFPMTDAQGQRLLAILDGEAPDAAAPASEAPAVDARTHDILKVLTRIPVARGQVLFFRLLRDMPQGVTAADVQARVFDEDPRQGAGLLAALSRRINGTQLATGANPGIELVARNEKGRWIARPELWRAIELLPPLQDAIGRPWQEMLDDGSYITVAMPRGLALAQASKSDAPVAAWTRVRDAVAKELVIADDTLAAYLLALQAKRFVIFSGISGTGKTRLAQTVARWAAGGHAPAPAPVARTGVEIELQPYMFDHRRLTVPAAVARRARLPSSAAGWSSGEVEVTWPEGKASLKVGSDAARPELRTLFLKGDAFSWLQRVAQVGDRVLLDVVPGPEDGWDGLAISLPRHGASAPPRTFEIIPVRPDWRDTRPLLGFYNPITETYARTPFLDLLLAARTEEGRAEKEGREPLPFFAVLDEMNLAHVEQYFADVLSAMESGEEIPLHADTRVEQGLADGSEQVPARVRLPRNLFVVGTVNVDETTHAFSPKVLDRAFVLELSEVWLDGAPPPGQLLLTRLPDQLSLLGRLDGTAWERLADTAGPDARRTLVALHATLAHEGRPIGYRPIYEMARFLQLAYEQGAEPGVGIESALDQVVLQKVLPKLSGRQHELEPVLRRLFDVAVDGRASLDDAFHHDPTHWRRRPDGRLGRAEDAPDNSLSVPRLPRTAARLHRMIVDVRRQGFVSFLG